MILAIDMGNTNIKIGAINGPDDITEERVTTDYNKSSLEYAGDILNVLTFHNLRRESIEGAILSSVVPPLSGVLSTAVKKVFGSEPIEVTSKLRMDIKLSNFKYKSGIGSDLLVGAEGVYTHYKAPCILINMGTATTVMVVDEDGEFLGGSIMPGMKQSAIGLASSTAMLPEINLFKPGRVISRETSQCMRSGIVYGFSGGIDEIIDRAEEELGKKCTHVACGGMAPFAIPYCRHEIITDEKLLMRGLLKLYELNAEKK